MRADLTRGELEDRQAVAASVAATEHGEQFIAYLLEDLCLYDIAMEEADMVTKNFALLLLKRYFGVTADYGLPSLNRDHRSLLTRAIIGVWKPNAPEEKDE